MVDGNGVSDPRQPRQQYDHRGRPVNPDTKRRNRDIIRSHNEVMLVIGVAEPEHPASRPEFKSQQRHYEYEEEAGQRLNTAANRCIDVAGLFGIHGLRQRILVGQSSSMAWFKWNLITDVNRYIVAILSSHSLSSFAGRGPTFQFRETSCLVYHLVSCAALPTLRSNDG